MTPHLLNIQDRSRKEAARDHTLARIEAVRDALDDLEWIARGMHGGVYDTKEMLSFMRASDMLTATDAHVRYREEIEVEIGR